jgi:hypothetical protein
MILGDLVWRFVDRLRGRWEPKSLPPLHKLYTPREEHEKLERRVENITDEMRSGFEKAAEAASGSRKEIYLSIRKLEQSTATLAEGQRTQGMQLARLDTKMDTLLTRLTKPHE